MSRAKVMIDSAGRFWAMRIWCPACKWADDGTPHAHVLQVDWTPPGMERSPDMHPDLWGFNGDLERPTFTPSLLLRYDRHEPPVTVSNMAEWERQPWPQKVVPYVCHSFINAGRIQFLGDCTHELAGQTVDLLEIE